MKNKILFIVIGILILFASCKKVDNWNRAIEYYNAHKYEKAIKYFERSIKDVPLRIDSAHYMIGECYFKMQKYEKAKKAFKEIIEQRDSDELVRSYLGAMASFNSGNFQKALPYFESIVHTNPSYKDGQAFFRYVRTIKELFGIDKALSEAELGLKILPGYINEEGIFNLNNLYSNLLMKKNKFKEAEKYLKYCLSYNDKDFLVHYNLGITYESLKRYDDAKSQYFQSFALGKMEKAKWKYFNLLSLSEIGNNLDMFNFKPKGFKLFKKGISEFNMGNFEMFRYTIQKSLELDYTIERLLYQWGNYQLRNSADGLYKANIDHYVFGNRDKALEIYKSIPSSYDSDLNFAIFLIKAGEFDEANTIFNGMNIGNKDHRKLFYIGLMQLNQKKIDLAVESFKKAAKLNDNILTLIYFQGILVDISKVNIKDDDKVIDLLLKNSKDKEVRSWIGKNIKN
jgi:tetratricopeptide (TPR) repeat protein